MRCSHARSAQRHHLLGLLRKYFGSRYLHTRRKRGAIGAPAGCWRNPISNYSRLLLQTPYAEENRLSSDRELRWASPDDLAAKLLAGASRSYAFVYCPEPSDKEVCFGSCFAWERQNQHGFILSRSYRVTTSLWQAHIICNLSAWPGVHLHLAIVSFVTLDTLHLSIMRPLDERKQY